MNNTGSRPRFRSLAALCILLIGLGLYAALVTSVFDWLPDHLFLQTLFIAFSGLAWVWPAIKLTGWAQRRD
jgi:hypothetical protein